MVEKRHSKIFRHKAFTILSLIAVVVAIIILLRIKSLKDTYKSESEDLVPLVSLISTVLQWKDSAYCVVAESGDLCPILEKENEKISEYKKLTYKEFINLSCRDTLVVDSISFEILKKYVVLPQARVDSIYIRNGVQGLLLAYFDDKWFNGDSLLTSPEQRYVIFLLRRNQYDVDVDDESGYLYISPSDPNLK